MKNADRSYRFNRDADTGRFTIGREAFARISAVEGLALSEEMRRDLEAFDRAGTAPEERRRAAIAKYGKR